MTRQRTSESGSVFTILMAGIAMAAALSVVLYSTISGPMSSMVRITNKTTAKSQMQSIASIIIMDAINNMPNNGDCTGTGVGMVVPRSWKPGTGPTGGGLLPTTIGAPLTDPWGTSYGYCVWEVGGASLAAGCDTVNGYNQTCTGVSSTNTCTGGTAPNINVGYNALRLLGTPTPSSGSASSQVVFAVISAGPNRTFNSTCAAYNSGSPAATLVTPGGDDIVVSYTYAQASVATSSLWTLNPASASTAIINKNLAVGPTATPTFQVNSSTGLINALGLTATGAIMSTGGAIGLANVTSASAALGAGTCVSGTLGQMYYNTTTNLVDVCTCTGGSCPATGTFSWTPLTTGSSSALNNITAATNTNTIDSLTYGGQVWNWSTLTAGTTALTLSAGNAAGAADTTLAVTNNTTGAGKAVSATLSGAGNTGAAGYFTNTGGGYALITGTGNVGIGTTAPGGLLSVANTSGYEQFRVINGGNAVNYAEVYGSTTGNGVFYTADGSDTNIQVRLSSKGTGVVNLLNNNIASVVINRSGVIGAVNNRLAITAGDATGVYPVIASSCSDTNCGLILSPQGSGGVGIGTTSPTIGHLQIQGTTASSEQLYVVNSATSGRNYGIDGKANGSGATTNVAGYFAASGATNNYAIIVPSGYGNVGIGTTSPSSKLTLQFASALTTFNSGGAVDILNTDTTTNNVTPIRFLMRDTNVGTKTGAVIAAVFTNHNESAETGDLAFLTNQTTLLSEKMRIMGSGNVGIGTSTPNELLHVYGSGNVVNVIQSSNGVTAATRYISGVDTFQVGGEVGGMMGYGIMDETAGNTMRLEILNNGNVGIGTTVPSYPLDIKVAGSVVAARLYGQFGANSDNLQLRFAGQKDGELWAIGDDISLGGSTGDFEFYNLGNAGGSAGAKLTILGNGNVGIGTTTPDTTLKVVANNGAWTGWFTNQSNADYAYLADGGSGGFGAYVGGTTWGLFSAAGTNYFAGYVGIGTASPGYPLTVNGQPGANGYTAFTNYSDRRLNEDIHYLDAGSLEKVLQLKPAHFRYNDKYFAVTGYDKKSQKRVLTGFIAQDLQKVFPEMVTDKKIGKESYFDTNLSYLQIHLVKAIQELYAKFAALVSEVMQLKADNDNLKADDRKQFAALKAANDNEAAQIKALTARLDALEAAHH